MKALPFFPTTLALGASLFFASCSKESDNIQPLAATQESSIRGGNGNGSTNGNGAIGEARPLPCDTYNYHMVYNGNGNGTWIQDVVRTEYMTRKLLNLNYEVFMQQTKYTITPSGKETSVWEGTLTEKADIPTAQTTFLSEAWSECGKHYASECKKFANGKIMLTLVHDPANQASASSQGQGN
ncbi:hypothetical protein FY528_09205 [Hymenobacter lutimineralis]|uniref:Lipoprotein n=1 Tax=Hymenobacter lutimineralis TaxID=2606448 RepID=A0A5D6V5V6_9BACT|nr:hypothetical protein [Hymenobacter lutimineralis]TYZ10034.1 hypothetical protein FY528_09205 [Hymenobacter lutimineralis]